jgi:hypothetical protein
MSTDERSGASEPAAVATDDLGALQDALAEALKAYAKAFGEGLRALPFEERHGVTQTEAVIAASQILKAAEVEPFELQLWESWGIR